MGKAYMGARSQGFGGQKESRTINLKVSLDVYLLLTEFFLSDPLLLNSDVACTNFHPGIT